MSADKLRAEVAQAAARMICEQGIIDYAAAKQRAAEQIFGHARGAMPSNSEVADGIRDYLQVFEYEQWQQRLSALRQTAIKAMELTQEFSPLATGAVVSGLATVRSAVRLHLFCPFDEALDFFLGDRNIPFDEDEVRVKHPSGREIVRPSSVFMAEDVEVQLLVFAEEDRRWSPLSGIDGKPMERWDLTKLRASLNH